MITLSEVQIPFLPLSFLKGCEFFFGDSVFHRLSRGAGRDSPFSRSIQSLQSSDQSFESKLPVLCLGPVFRGNDRDPGGKVFQSHRGLGFVLSLASGATGAVGFHNDLPLQGVDIGVEFWMGGIHGSILLSHPHDA